MTTIPKKSHPRRFVVHQDMSYGFTRSERIYKIVDSTTNTWADDLEFTNKRLAAKYAADLNRQICTTCGSNNLFSGFFDLEGYAVPDDRGDGWRWTTYCNECGAEQP